MFDVRLSFYRTRDGKLLFAIPMGTRLLFAGIALAAAASAAASVEASSVYEFARALPAALGGAGFAVVLSAAAAACYEERWTFDPASRSVRFRFGLLFLARTRSVPFDSIESAEVETFVKGANPGGDAEPSGNKKLFRKKEYASLTLYLKDADRLIVETVPARGRLPLEEAAEEISRLIS